MTESQEPPNDVPRCKLIGINCFLQYLDVIFHKVIGRNRRTYLVFLVTDQVRRRSCLVHFCVTTFHNRFSGLRRLYGIIIESLSPSDVDISIPVRAGRIGHGLTVGYGSVDGWGLRVTYTHTDG